MSILSNRHAHALSPALRPGQPTRVYGRAIPEPRLTFHGLWVALTWVGPPLVLALLVLDLLVSAVAQAAFGACVALWCLI